MMKNCALHFRTRCCFCCYEAALWRKDEGIISSMASSRIALNLGRNSHDLTQAQRECPFDLSLVGRCPAYRRTSHPSHLRREACRRDELSHTHVPTPPISSNQLHTFHAPSERAQAQCPPGLRTAARLESGTLAILLHPEPLQGCPPGFEASQGMETSSTCDLLSWQPTKNLLFQSLEAR